MTYGDGGDGGDDGADGVWTISPAEGLPFAVAASTYISDPVWSPDGSRIALVGSTADGLGWFAVDAEGAGQRLEIDELTHLSWRGSRLPARLPDSLSGLRGRTGSPVPHGEPEV